MLTFFGFAVFAAVAAMLGAIMWAWGAYLDKHEHDPARVRAVMLLILLVAAPTEVGLASQGYVKPWVLSASLLANLWGGFDAVLRYPGAHSLTSFFGIKQCTLIAVKTLAYTFGMYAFKWDSAVFWIMLLIDVWGLPILYLMAVPMNPKEQVVADDAYDVDLAVRLWQLACSSLERRRCVATCKGWWYRELHTASERSAIARFAICAASSEHRRALGKRGRSV